MLRPAEYCSNDESDESDYGAMLAETISNRCSQIVYGDDNNGLDLELNANDYEYERDPEQQLLDAVIDGDCHRFESLLEHEPFAGRDLNETLIKNQPPVLILACLHANFELIRVLVARGASARLEFDGVNALIAICTVERMASTAQEIKHAATVRLLVESGIDYNVRDKHLEMPAFLWAVRNGHLETIKYLLTLPRLEYAVVDARRRNALMLAIDERQEHVVFYFMKRNLFRGPNDTEECLRKIFEACANRVHDSDSTTEFLMQKIASALVTCPDHGPLAIGLFKEIADLSMNGAYFLQLFRMRYKLYDLYEYPLQTIPAAAAAADESQFNRKFCDLLAAQQFNNLLFPFFVIYQKQNQSYRKSQKYENLRALPLFANSYRARDYFATVKNLFRVVFVTRIQLSYFRDVFAKMVQRPQTCERLSEIRDRTLSIRRKLDTLRTFYSYNKCFS